MEQSLENVVRKNSIKEEIAQGLRNYSSKWKEYLRQLGPAVIVSSIGSGVGQSVAHKLGYDSPVAQTAAGYLGGYLSGYTTYLSTEYLMHKERYPNGVFSKEFAHMVGTFLAADYIADLTTFTPTFVSSNLWLVNHSDLSPFARGIITFNGAGLLYISAMAGLHPTIKKVTKAINESVVKGIRKMRAVSKHK